MKKRVNPMVRVPKGMSTHPSMVAPAIKLLSDFHLIRGGVIKSLQEVGVDMKSILKSLSGDIDVYKKVKKEKEKKKIEVVVKARKKHIHLSATTKEALKKDSKKMNTKELATKYGITTATVLNICRK